MKNMKKIASLVMTVIMVFAMLTTTLADTPEIGSITVTNAVEGQTYSIYRIFDLDSYDAGDDTASYVYTVNDEWLGFVTSDKVKGVYLNRDSHGYISWIEGADPATFAQLAIEYAKNTTNKISPTDTKKATANGELVFINLDLGYYLLDSSIGTVCSLDTTNPDVEITDKNIGPTIDKKVYENTTHEYGDTNDADIGSTIQFRTHIHAGKGAESYVLYDTMSEGLTLDLESIKVVYYKGVGNSEFDTGTGDYKVKTGTDAKVGETQYTFIIEFTDAFVKTMGENEYTIVVYYEATLNENAVIAGEGNINTTYLEYGDHGKTKEDTTKTYTYEFDLVKTNADKVLLDGAVFELYNSKADLDGNKPIRFVSETEEDTGEPIQVYRVATSEDTTTTREITVSGGRVRIQGLDGNFTYVLKEKTAPGGYNLLNGTVDYTLNTDAECKATIVKVTDSETGAETRKYEKGGLQIINNAGAELPTTGGVGTTIFYVLGGVLVVFAAVILITKKRMGHEE